MPLERKSQGFLDLSLTFKQNPLSQDLITLKNDVAIARSVRNLVLTSAGERFFNPTLGSEISRLLFDNISDITADQIKDEISRVINLYEPRVSLIRVICRPDYDSGEYAITIRYRIVGIDATIEDLSFVLQATR